MIRLRPAILMAALLALAGTAVSAPATAVSAPAAAAGGGIEVSTDGVSFGAASPSVLFPSFGRMVPGDTLNGRFWIRNTSDLAAELHLGLLVIERLDLEYARALTLQIGLDGASPITRVVGDVPSCAELESSYPIGAGETVEVATRFEFAGVTGQAGQNGRVVLAFAVSMNDRPDGIVQAAKVCEGGLLVPATPGVPETGSRSSETLLSVRTNSAHLLEEYAVLIPVAAFVVGIILNFVIGRRRRAENDPHPTATQEVSP